MLNIFLPISLNICLGAQKNRHIETVPRGCLRFVIVVFPDHTHLLFFYPKDLLMVFQYKMLYLVVSKKTYPLFVCDGIKRSVPQDQHFSSLGKPRDANQ